MAQAVQRQEPMIHVRFQGQTWQFPLVELDVGLEAADEEIKRAVARYLGVAPAGLALYVVERYRNGNLTIRPEAIFG